MSFHTRLSGGLELIMKGGLKTHNVNFHPVAFGLCTYMVHILVLCFVQVNVPDEANTVSHLIKWCVSNVSSLAACSAPFGPDPADSADAFRLSPSAPKCSSSATACAASAFAPAVSYNACPCSFPLLMLLYSRAGILVLVNGADWELDGGGSAAVKDGDEARPTSWPSNPNPATIIFSLFLCIINRSRL
jgi:hypothetical protein